ncbi:LysR family transcriptional regulator [Vibrio alginolyticus]
MKNSFDFIVFYCVVTSGSFSQAAIKLGIAKSAVSKIVFRMEEEVGVQLLYRTTRKLFLTEAGSKLFVGAKKVYDAAKKADEALNGLEQNLSGTIKLTVPTISGELIFPEIIYEFNNKFPKIKIDMDLDNKYLDIEDNGFDLAVRTGSYPDPSFNVRKLVDAKWTTCLSPMYIAKHGLPDSPSELNRHKCLTYSFQEGGANIWSFKNAKKRYEVEVNSTFSSNNSSVLRNLAIWGNGIVYVPRILIYDDIKNGSLVEIFKYDTAKEIGIYAIYPKSRTQSEKVELLIEHIYDKFNQRNSHF